jgi:hypothetical protein
MRHTSPPGPPNPVSLLPPGVPQPTPLGPLVSLPGGAGRSPTSLLAAGSRAVPLATVTWRAHDHQTPAPVAHQQPPVRQTRAPLRLGSPTTCATGAAALYSQRGMLPVAAASLVCRPRGSLPVFLSADYLPRRTDHRQRPRPRSRHRLMTLLGYIPRRKARSPRILTAGDNPHNGAGLVPRPRGDGANAVPRNMPVPNMPVPSQTIPTIFENTVSASRLGRLVGLPSRAA